MHGETAAKRSQWGAVSVGLSSVDGAAPLAFHAIDDGRDRKPERPASASRVRLDKRQ